MTRQLERRPPHLDDKALTECRDVSDEDELDGVRLAGDFASAEISLLVVHQSRFDDAVFTGTRLVRATFVDCVIADCEWSGAVLEDCRFERVEFHRCRMSGIQAQGSRFTDVAFFDCRIDGGNFRTTVWERGELRDSNLADGDFYGAKLPGTRLHGCDLSNVELSKADLTGSSLHRSRLDGIRDGDALRGVTIGSDQLIPAALTVFGAMGIRVEDDEGDVS